MTDVAGPIREDEIYALLSATQVDELERQRGHVQAGVGRKGAMIPYAPPLSLSFSNLIVAHCVRQIAPWPDIHRLRATLRFFYASAKYHRPKAVTLLSHV